MPVRLLTAVVLVSTMFVSQTNADGHIEKGEAVFQNCMACHGEQAMGDEDNEAPRLAGQHSWYLVTQLENFRAGVRGAHEDDDNGQMMRAMAMTLSDDDIEDVVAYISTLPTE